MADRKTTPDILGSLLAGGADPEPTIKPEYHNTGIPADHKAIKPEGKPTIKPVRTKKTPAPVQASEEATKVKATFYISSSVVDRLEEGWSTLRSISPKEKRGEISKSLIVEAGLQAVLEDLAKKGKESLLAKKVNRS
jgi:hypothetical protein